MLLRASSSRLARSVTTLASAAATLVLSAPLTGCLSQRTVSPPLFSADRAVDAVLVSTHRPLSSTIGYEVYLSVPGSPRGQLAVTLRNAILSNGTGGVDLRWTGRRDLEVRCFRAETAVQLLETATLAGETVTIHLRVGA